MTACIKKRKIPVDGVRCVECEAEIEGAVGVLKGVRQVRADHKKGIVAVEYDLMKLSLRQIEKQIQEAGFNLKRGFYKLKSGLLHFTEENERNNLTSSAGECCSNPKLPHKK
jgi:copper chaperone CopZ